MFIGCTACICFFLMIRTPPRSTRTDTLFPYTTLFRSGQTGLYGATESYLLNGIYAQADSVTLSEDPDPNVTGNVLEVGGVGAAPGTLRRVLSTPHATAGIATRT